MLQSPYIITAIFLFLCSRIISQSISDKASKHLTDEEKKLGGQIFKTWQKRKYVIAFALLCTFFLVLAASKEHVIRLYSFYSAMLAIGLALVLFTSKEFKEYQEAKLNIQWIASYKKAKLVHFIGVSGVMVLLSLYVASQVP